MRYTYRQIAERIIDRRERAEKMHDGPFPQERALLRIELLLESLLEVAIRNDAGVQEAIRDLERERE